ncbi:hypothetical protein [Actinoplanes solisilvae]|uniref:hypothetical protein n=1 Tax=Actinoplanes solisilvae TaxID=2486853 RepID=UPI00196AC8CA|nr:hypothetical protein [Actinoplanes solisilvae]
MVPGDAFVAVPVVAGEAGHQFLRVAARLDLGEETGGGRTAQGSGRPPMMQQFDVAVLADAIGETVTSQCALVSTWSVVLPCSGTVPV